MFNWAFAKVLVLRAMLDSAEETEDVKVVALERLSRFKMKIRKNATRSEHENSPSMKDSAKP